MHKAKKSPNPSPEDPCGVNAKILEGWLDLRIRNDTAEAVQIELPRHDTYYYGRILVDSAPEKTYTGINRNLRYTHRKGKIFESADVIR